MHEVKRLNADHATDLVTLGQQAYTANATESKEKLDEIIEKRKRIWLVRSANTMGLCKPIN